MKPDWLRIKLVTSKRFADTAAVLKELNLATVCDGARCPNKCACWGSGTATFMILGSTCTRGCRFCSVRKGAPEAVDGSEPGRIAEAVRRLALRYVVITSVDRDDLRDGGAAHFAQCIREVKRIGAMVEVLIPDYEGDALASVVAAGPDVIAHNVETVKRLTPVVRDARAGYEKSIEVLRNAKRLNKEVRTKSSLMLGFGESAAEVLEAMRDLRSAGVDMLAMGQYLRPSQKQVEVARYATPEEFAELQGIAERMGFACASGPFVRSSFGAAGLLDGCNAR